MATGKTISKPPEDKVAMGEERENQQISRRSRRRRERQPLGTTRTKLSIPPKLRQLFADQQEVPHWINDDPGRLEAATMEDSYRFVDKKELSGVPIPVGEGEAVVDPLALGSKVAVVVGSRRDGSPVTAYLMAKPLEDYEEDMRTKRAAIDQKEAAMKRGMTEPVENMYIPATGIKIVTGSEK